MERVLGEKRGLSLLGRARIGRRAPRRLAPRLFLPSFLRPKTQYDETRSLSSLEVDLDHNDARGLYYDDDSSSEGTSSEEAWYDELPPGGSYSDEHELFDSLSEESSQTNHDDDEHSSSLTPTAATILSDTDRSPLSSPLSIDDNTHNVLLLKEEEEEEEAEQEEAEEDTENDRIDKEKQIDDAVKRKHLNREKKKQHLETIMARYLSNEKQKLHSEGAPENDGNDENNRKAPLSPSRTDIPAFELSSSSLSFNDTNKNIKSASSETGAADSFKKSSQRYRDEKKQQLEAIMARYLSNEKKMLHSFTPEKDDSIARDDSLEKDDSPEKDEESDNDTEKTPPSPPSQITTTAVPSVDEESKSVSSYNNNTDEPIKEDDESHMESIMSRDLSNDNEETKQDSDGLIARGPEKDDSSITLPPTIPARREAIESQTLSPKIDFGDWRKINDPPSSPAETAATAEVSSSFISFEDETKSLTLLPKEEMSEASDDDDDDSVETSHIPNLEKKIHLKGMMARWAVMDFKSEERLEELLSTVDSSRNSSDGFSFVEDLQGKPTSYPVPSLSSSPFPSPSSSFLSKEAEQEHTEVSTKIEGDNAEKERCDDELCKEDSSNHDTTNTNTNSSVSTRSSASLSEFLRTVLSKEEEDRVEEMLAKTEGRTLRTVLSKEEEERVEEMVVRMEERQRSIRTVLSKEEEERVEEMVEETRRNTILSHFRNLRTVLFKDVEQIMATMEDEETNTVKAEDATKTAISNTNTDPSVAGRISPSLFEFRSSSTPNTAKAVSHVEVVWQD